MRHKIRTNRRMLFAPFVASLFLVTVAVPSSAYEGQNFNVDATVNGEPIDYDILYQNGRAEKITGSVSGDPPTSVSWTIDHIRGRAVHFDHIVVVEQAYCSDPIPECRETLFAASNVPTNHFEYSFDEAGSYFVWLAAATDGRGGATFIQIDTYIEVSDPWTKPGMEVPGQGDERRNERANEAVASHCDRGNAGSNSKHCR